MKELKTRGIRNDNPLNIRHGKSRWVGMRKAQTDRAFVQFIERKYGYRAAFILLRNYIRGGHNTIRKIIARWAPPSDGNNTQAYICFVSTTTGIDANLVIDFNNKDVMVNVVRSMAQMESGIVEDEEIVSCAYDLVNS